MRARTLVATSSLLVLSTAYGCGAGKPKEPPVPAPLPSASAPAASSSAAWVESPDAALPGLRTGTIAPVVEPAAAAKVLKRHVAGGIETLLVEVPALRGRWAARESTVAVDGGRGVSFVRPTSQGQTAVWVRRAASEAGKPLAGEIEVPATDPQPGRRIPFRVESPSAPDDPELLAQWGSELADAFGFPYSSATPWHAFAADRVRSVFVPAKRTPAPRGRRVPTPMFRTDDDLVRLMETTTGTTSIQEALQHDRALLVAASKAKRSVPIEKLVPPHLQEHPWKEMIAKLPAVDAKEPLASVAPAEFWFARANGLDAVFRLLDEAETWATPIVSALDDRGEDRALAERYETELGIRRGPLTRAFGPEVVAELAVVGSDPYVREGTDVTLIFRVKQRVLFDAALAAALDDRGRAHGGITSSSDVHEDVTVRASTSADGAVHQSRATLGDLELVSNSPAAIRRVVDAAKGKRAKLADEPDFRFALARDPSVASDVFVFLGDRFVSEVIGPKQKISEARREIALAELSTPAYAALLHGWIFGESPRSIDQLVKSKLLDRRELTHGTGEPITFQLGEAPRSRFGTTRALVPILDLPIPDRVSEGEQAAYARFAQSYERSWSGYVDPVAGRISLKKGEGGTELAADVRVLPLIDSSDYRDISRAVGNSRVHADPLASGLRVVVGIGKDDRTRSDLNDLFRFVASVPGLPKLDWVGDWAMIGTLDRNAIARAVASLDPRSLPQRRPSGDDEERSRDERIVEALHAPVYAAVAVSSRAAAAIALGVARKFAEDAVPGNIEWGEHGVDRGVSIVRVLVRGGRSSPVDSDVAVYYALDDDALLVALSEAAIRAAIETRADGRGPSSVRGKSTDGAPQMVVDLATEKGRGLYTVLAWLLESDAIDSGSRSREAAEVIFRGAPESAQDPALAKRLALAYLGAVPVPPDGGVYSFSKDGVVDPTRGTAVAPIWPDVPVAGSRVARALDAVARVRTELSFDDEGKSPRGAPMQSLHAKTSIFVRDR